MATDSPDTSWMSKGNCSGVGFDVMHPIGGGKGRKTKDHDPSVNPISTAEKEKYAADIYCNGKGNAQKGGSTKVCPSKEQCLNYAIATAQRSGAWGGTNSEERDSLVNAAQTNFYGTKVGKY